MSKFGNYLSEQTKAILGRLWARNDKLQLAGFLLTVVGLFLVYYQLRLNNETNKVSIRGQFYDRQTAMGASVGAADAEILNTLWALPSTQFPTDQSLNLLSPIVTSDQTALKAKNPSELYRSMFDAAVFADLSRSKNTQGLRRLFLYTQDEFYQVHNIFDYKQDGIITEAEWHTWKGTIREMHGHPMLLTVIWQGYQNRYFSRQFAQFLQTELCPDGIPTDVADVDGFKRDCQFVKSFYPEMLTKEWPNALPDY